MQAGFEVILLGTALILFLGVVASKLSDYLGVPALLLFLALGMLAGSEGPGGIYFDDNRLAQSVGVVALVFILFSGGLDTKWETIRPVLKEGISLSTLGVFLTAVVVGIFATIFLGFSLPQGLLLGSIVSSTDAAAVLSILRSRGVSLKGRLKSLLEFESGSNDPMAVLLTIGVVEWITQPSLSGGELAYQFILQFALGTLLGLAGGRGLVYLINKVRLGYEGLHPVLTIAAVLLVYALTTLLGGSGFLAVYLAGVVIGERDIIHRRSLASFHDGLAWLMQIAMFVILGLLVFPSQLIRVIPVGLAVAACLMLVARPAGVFLSVLPFGYSLREKMFLSWVGLRGAVPIVLATYPLISGVSEAGQMFNIVFFVVIASVLLQGTSVPIVARWLKVDAPLVKKLQYPIEFTPQSGLSSELKELPIPTGSPVHGKAIVELGLPDDFLVLLIARDEEFQVPSGGTILAAGDTLLVLSEEKSFARVQAQVGLPLS